MLFLRATSCRALCRACLPRGRPPMGQPASANGLHGPKKRSVSPTHGGPRGPPEGSLRLQPGGQTYSGLIVFENEAAMDRSKANQFNFGANASAVIAKEGTATSIQFVDGGAAFVKPVGGGVGAAGLPGPRSTYAPK